MKSSWKCIQYPHDCYQTSFISAADFHAKYVRSKVGPIASFSLPTLEIVYRSSGKSLKNTGSILSAGVKRGVYIFKAFPLYQAVLVWVMMPLRRSSLYPLQFNKSPIIYLYI